MAAASSSSSSSCKSFPSPPTPQEASSGHAASPAIAGPRSNARALVPDNEAELCACDTFCQALHRNTTSETPHQAGGNWARGGSLKNFGHARKAHKADREKHRRDRLNEQLMELADALEPDRPKNDKSTILGDAIQALKELSMEVDRLRAERNLLVEASHDLSLEKKELQAEKSQLKVGIEQLQCQFQQQMQAMLLWMTSGDPSAMLNGGGFPYDLRSVDRPGHQQAAHMQPQAPFLAPGSPYMPMSLLPAAHFPMHPALHAHYGHAGRGIPDLSYLYNVSHARGNTDAPFSYPVHVHHPNAMRPHSQSAPPFGLAYGPGYPYMMPQSQGTDPGSSSFLHGRQSSAEGHVSSTFPLTLGLNGAQANFDPEDPAQHVHTGLQLQTPSAALPGRQNV